ncbi:MAG: FAD-binding oxidoreductase, partial [Coriobacteriales bacterium]|nr:FAD-binding oxidoreductase [Coriobacteriales bacterium]
MKVISSLVNKKIRAIVGTERYRSDRRERKMYSFDIGVMPALIKPFVNAGIAGGVARPANEAQIQALVKLATKEHLTIVPRAAATSGYGGVLPRNGALVIDLNSLDQLLSVDTEQLIVRCQAGAIWEKIDKQLADYGLELALHPSSYPSSTVGGWLAQGGSGFGSFEYGSFKEIVISTRVVLPDGSIREFTGEELQDVIADAEGITGIITEVTFRARKKEAQETRLVSFCDAASIASVLIAISEAQLPIWSLTFLNPAAI